MSTEEKTLNKEENVTGKQKIVEDISETGGLIEEEILDLLDKLPYEKVQEVLDFVKFLVQQVEKNPPPKKPFRSSRGILAGLIDIDEEDFKQLRREMWGGFPRDITQ